jgi:phosphinothricin acetyltransferase
VLRPYRATDAAAVLALYEPFVRDSGVTFETELPSLEDFSKRLAHIAGRFPFWVWEDGGTVLGYAYGTAHRERIAYQWAVETSVYVGRPGEGIGKQLYQKVLSELRDRGFVWAYGVITLPNEPSLALHEACGFKPFARYDNAGQKSGTWYDVQWVRCGLNSVVPGMAEPQYGPSVE